MDLSDLALGFQTALSVEALLYCLAGVTIGMFIGVLPGIGPIATVSMLLPITFYMTPTSALIMLAGIYYGAQYGGSITSILVNLPGGASSSVTCLDGYPMAQQGRAGVALFLTTIASFVGSLIAVVALAAFAAPLASVALNFGSPEYFSMMLVGLIAAATVAQGSPLKGLAMVGVGLLIGLVGTDINTGAERFTFGAASLWDGVSIVPLAMGVFGVSEILSNLFGTPQEHRPSVDVNWRSMMPTRDDLRQAAAPILRGSGIGVLFGVLPGSGPTIASFLSYAVEKKVSRHPDRFGKGAVEGISAPEAANNAVAQAAFIPTLTLGIPGDAMMALMLGAMIIHGIEPGPGVLTEHPEMFWGLVASFWVGNIMLVILNIPLIGLWVRLLSIPDRFLYPAILIFVSVGAYSINANPFDVYLVAFFGVLGYVMRQLGFEPAPLVLGFILGPMIEENLRRSLILSGGDYAIFITQPISAAFLAAGALILAKQLFWDTLRR